MVIVYQQIKSTASCFGVRALIKVVTDNISDCNLAIDGRQGWLEFTQVSLGQTGIELTQYVTLTCPQTNAKTGL